MSLPRDPSATPPESEPRFRWQALFQHAAEPLFLLSARRRVLFVNRAWEALTGVALADVKGQICRRRPRGTVAEKIDLLLGAMAPPAEVMDGKPAQARRQPPPGPHTIWWQIDFFPFTGSAGLAGILGKITVLAPPPAAAGPPLSEKLSALRHRHAMRYDLAELIGDTPAVVRLRQQIRLAGQTRMPALIAGPPGSGKLWVARAIHQLSGDRERSFGCLDCARLAPSRLSELLLGAAPFASIYLQNLAHLPLDLQERLRQMLDVEDGSAARILAGLSQDPLELVRSGQLLDDLYCRLSPVILEVSPLKDRMDDFDDWIERLLPRANQAAERSLRGVSAEALLILRAYAWPGNLRELYDVLLQSCLHARGERIEASDLPFHVRHGPIPEDKPLNLDAILEEIERRLIVNALRQAKNNKSRAAELLTIWRPRLLRRMENLGIEDQ